MAGRTVGVVAVSLGVLLAARALLSSSSPFMVDQALALIAIVLILALQYALWSLSVGKPGRPLLLAAFILTLLGNLVPLLLLLRRPLPLPSAILQPAVTFVAALLFGVGLIRGRLIPQWIPPFWIGAVSVAVAGRVWRIAASFAPANATLEFWQRAVDHLGTGLAVVFWVALGMSLIRTERPGRAEHAHPADSSPREVSSG